MNPTQLLDHFDRISDAPDAVPRLRRFILDLAVRGKLVEQDPSDEPASSLLERLQLEKVRLVKAGEIRNPRAVEARDETEPFPVPPRWVWCRLSDVGAIVGGSTPPSGDVDNFAAGGCAIAWLTPADLGKHKDLYVSHGARDLTPQGLHSSSATLMPKGSVLFTSRAPIGYTAIATNEVSTNQGFKSVVPFISKCNLYIAIYFRAFAKWIDGKACGTTFREVSGKVVSNLPFPLPPLAEQHRIVTKVDELMALCDRLEAAQAERERRRDRLTAASLHRLNAFADAPAFRDHVNFHLRNFPRFTTLPDQVPALRQSILNLAVGGHLVPQDAEDETASELIKRIQTEKTRLIQQGVIRKSKKLSTVDPTEVSVRLPDSWSWAKAETICEVVIDCPHSTPVFVPSGIVCIDTNCFKEGELIRHKIRYVSETTYDERVRRIVPRTGDVIFAREGSVGASVIVPEGLKCCLGQRVMLFRMMPGILPAYFSLSLSEPSSLTRLLALHKGIGARHVNVEDMRSALIPLPPLGEQHRIVAKVDELMAVCDRLEAALTTAQTESRRLLEAVLHEALAAAV